MKYIFFISIIIMFEYIFIIYSCNLEHNIYKAKNLYNLIKNRLKSCKPYIIYGNPNLETEYKIDNEFLILKVEDGYEYLNKKTIKLINVINNLYFDTDLTGIFKCDDDVIPNLNNIQEFIELNKNKSIDYSGKINSVKK